MGCWNLLSGDLHFELDSESPTRNVLYAFVCGSEVLHLGKTTVGLRRRLCGYKKPGPTQGTNIAVHGQIAKLLGSQACLDIYAYCDDGNLRLGPFRINVAAGLEDSLVRELRPPWNKLGK